MFTYTDWLVHLEHLKDILREAENERLAKIALAARRDHKAEKSAKPQLAKQIQSLETPCCKAATT